jgi:hypothetical protein
MFSFGMRDLRQLYSNLCAANFISCYRNNHICISFSFNPTTVFRADVIACPCCVTVMLVGPSHVTRNYVIAAAQGTSEFCSE